MKYLLNNHSFAIAGTMYTFVVLFFIAAFLFHLLEGIDLWSVITTVDELPMVEIDHSRSLDVQQVTQSGGLVYEK